MPFEKGKSGNPAGRKKGKPNTTTEELRRLLHEFIDNNIEQLQADFDKLEPKDRLTFIERLLKHVLPPMVTSLEQLSEADLDLLLDKLRNNEKSEVSRN